MAIYHLSIKNIGRSQGRSIISAAAYRSGTSLTDLETGLTHDYTRKGGIVHSEILLCKNAPADYNNRQKLWTAVQQAEKANNARLAREFEVAIPKELPKEQAMQLINDFAQSLADEGMCVDIAIHDTGKGNPHAHILTTTRPIKEDGTWGTKERKDYKLDKDGQRVPIIDPKTSKQKVDGRNRKQWQRILIDSTGWNQKTKAKEWRERWANCCNQYLPKSLQITDKSYKAQGLDTIPTIHEGHVARLIEARGGASEICGINRNIKEYNTLTGAIRAAEARIADIIGEELAKLNGRTSGHDGQTARASRPDTAIAIGQAAAIRRDTAAITTAAAASRADREAAEQRRRRAETDRAAAKAAEMGKKPAGKTKRSGRESYYGR